MPSKAIFLSYASQDADAARRISDTLRAAGVEVWFDQEGGLEHGDEWDAKIRQQIKDCILFIALISANTQARHEGYFRIEWDLAAERAQGIAAGVAFILPVIVDDTIEREALVPERFRKVQWLRLPGGELPLDVRARLLKLWSHRSSATPPPSNLGRGLPTPPFDAANTAGFGDPARQRRTMLLATCAAAALALGGWWFSRAPEVPGAASTVAPLVSPATPSTPTIAASEKSVVVLPFENLSPDPENAFFTDGIHSEIISKLQRLSDLKVISRGSALAFKAANLPVPEFAQKVGAANVITGTVRRAEGRVRITVELRRARDDHALWTPPPYERELKDIFAIQDAIAADVARLLQARVTKGSLESARYMTKNPAAYDLFLKLITSNEGGLSRLPEMEAAIKRMEEVAALDPEFMPAANMVSQAHSWASRLTVVPEIRQRHALEAKRWGEIASQLTPGGAGDAALSYYYSVVESDNTRALTLAENVVRALPYHSGGLHALGTALHRAGRVAEALATYRRAQELDPLDPSTLSSQLSMLSRLRRVEEWNATIELARGKFAVVAQGAERHQERYRLTAATPASRESMSPRDRAGWLWLDRKFAEAVETLDPKILPPRAADTTRYTWFIRRGDALRRVGRIEEAEADARTALDLAQKIGAASAVDASFNGYRLASALVRVGRTDEGLAEARRYVAATSSTNQVAEHRERETQLAELLAYAGHTRECVALLGKLLRVPSVITVPMLRSSPDWDNLRDDPEFKALLADPQNSAPL